VSVRGIRIQLQSLGLSQYSAQRLIPSLFSPSSLLSIFYFRGKAGEREPEMKKYIRGPLSLPTSLTFVPKSIVIYLRALFSISLTLTFPNRSLIPFHGIYSPSSSSASHYSVRDCLMGEFCHGIPILSEGRRKRSREQLSLQYGPSFLTAAARRTGLRVNRF
jgi:hypothetical protein